MEYHMVVNPAGASGRTKKRVDLLKPLIEKSGEKVEIHYSTKDCGIGELCRQLTKDADAEHPVNLIIAGGDGSLNEAVNGIENIPHVRLGILPAGSGNDLCRALGISSDLEKELARILEGKIRRPMDVGEVTCYGTYDHVGQNRVPDGKEYPEELKKRFNVSCGIGFDAAICERAERSRLKGFLNRIMLGKLIYLAAAMELIFTFRNTRMEVLMDGERTHCAENGLFFVWMNTGYEGGGFLFCPGADPDDGLLDLCAVNPKSNMVFFRLFPKAYTGKHVTEKIIHMDRAGVLEIRTSDWQWVHTDGEIGFQAKHIRMQTLADKLSLLN